MSLRYFIYLQEEKELETLSEEMHRGTEFLSEKVFFSRFWTFCWRTVDKFSSEGVVRAVTAIPLLTLQLLFIKRGDFEW